MSAKPEVFSLFWYAHSFGSERPLRVALQHKNVIDRRPAVPGIILFPALLTPAVHVKGENGGMIELLVVARKGPPLKPAHVNLHLKIAPGQEAKKCASRMPLFANPKGKIEIKEVQPDGHGIIGTHALFRGTIHPKFREGIPSELDAFYAVQIHESCLEGPGARPAGDDVRPTPEFQDVLMERVLKRLNGPELQGQDGRGTCEFVVGDDIDFSQVDQQRPIVAYHPLYVYPKGGLERANVGHVTDIHINARQEILHRSPARVIDDERAEAQAESPVIGKQISRCSAALISILAGMRQKAEEDCLDFLLVGGDLIDHIENAFAFTSKRDPASLQTLTARQVWDLVDLKKDYDTNYQSFVDLIGFFSIIRSHCGALGKPVFGITGNHDCWKKAYGISPRVLWRRPNEGIPADHNLTFYEATLVFGETFSEIKQTINFERDLFEWYYWVFTPFSDFSLELPKQRMVCLAWGEDEEIVSGPGSGGQDMGHLPRAEEAATDAQVALLKEGLTEAKKTLLLTHFTFVSYREDIAYSQGRGELDVAGTGLFRWGDPFTHYDMGTFEKNRDTLYTLASDAKKIACVLTGHSHRKGLYFLTGRRDMKYGTQAYPLQRVNPLPGDLPPEHADQTPIIVSDSAGPLPRLNLNNEFGAYGSDTPSGTLVKFGEDGRPIRIELVPAAVEAAKPRLAVAVDYTHVMKGRVIRDIRVTEFDRAKAMIWPHEFTIRFDESFPTQLSHEADVVLYARPALSAPWLRIEMEQTSISVNKAKETTISYGRGPTNGKSNYSAQFLEWLLLGSHAARFMSFGFARNKGGMSHIYEDSSRWNIAVKTRALPSAQSPKNPHPDQKARYMIIADNEGVSAPGEVPPDFSWRRRFRPYQ